MSGRMALWTGAILLSVGMAGLVAGWSIRAPLFPSAVNGSLGMFPAGMMGGDGTGAGGEAVINAGEVQAWVRVGDRGARISRAADTVTYTTRRVTLVALASPHGQPNMTWEIDGLVNPTVVVPAGAEVTVDLVNTDWGYRHGFEITTTPPPYSYVPMMSTQRDLFLMPLPPRSEKNLTGASYATESASLTLDAGTYYYLCPTPGHAQQGMYGKLVAAA